MKASSEGDLYRCLVLKKDGSVLCDFSSGTACAVLCDKAHIDNAFGSNFAVHLQNYLLILLPEFAPSGFESQFYGSVRWAPITEIMWGDSASSSLFKSIVASCPFEGFFSDDFVFSYSASVLEEYDLVKKTNAVFYNKKRCFFLDDMFIDALKFYVDLSGVSRFRCCLHLSDDDALHKMLMIQRRNVIVPAHRQMARFLSYHVIEGELDVSLYDDFGAEFHTVTLTGNASEKSFLCQLDASVFRSTRSKVDFTVFLETTTGPFLDSDTLWLD
jgi:cupin fold WbuC family metalloprotein